jgi:hypothetical protein
MPMERLIPTRRKERTTPMVGAAAGQCVPHVDPERLRQGRRRFTELWRRFYIRNPLTVECEGLR